MNSVPDATTDVISAQNYVKFIIPSADAKEYEHMVGTGDNVKGIVGVVQQHTEEYLDLADDYKDIVATRGKIILRP